MQASVPAITPTVRASQGSSSRNVSSASRLATVALNVNKSTGLDINAIVSRTNGPKAST